MEEVVLGTDVVLETIIGEPPGLVDKLVRQARQGEIQINVLHSTLYCALYSVKETDAVNAQRLAELLKYAQILPDAPEYLGPQDRELWTPSEEEIGNWRKCALDD